jgi:hypothetical protein
MKGVPVPRWAVSLADLALLLLGFFVLLQAGSPGAVAAGARAAFGAQPGAGPLVRARAERWFEPGEARLRGPARARLLAIGREAARGGARVTVESRGRGGGARRFDGWELAAARAAAVARALTEGGLDEAKVTIRLAEGAAEGIAGQLLTVRRQG